MNAIFDYFQKKEIPTLILLTPNLVPVASLKGCYNIHNVIRFNDLSELSFDFPQSPDNGTTILSAYELIRNKMIVLVKDVGYYIITECPENTTGAIPIKSVNCQSLESAMLFRRMTGFRIPPVQLYNSTNPQGSLLGIVLKYIPGWTVDYIDPDLLIGTDGKEIRRKFDIDNNTLYSFLISSAEVAYNCVFTFNSFDKTISAYAIANLADDDNKVGIFLSFNNVNKSLTLTEYSDEMTTGLYCFGNEGLDIAYVNPLGENVIYNFDYYKNSSWMAQDLIDALTAWENKVDSFQSSYSTLITLFYTQNYDLSALEAILAGQKAELAGLITERNATKVAKLSTTEVDEKIYNQKVLISTQREMIALKKDDINSTENDFRKINGQLKFTSKTNFEKYINDLSGIYTKYMNISKNWGAIYNPTSAEPGFDLAQYNANYTEVMTNFGYGNEQLNALFNSARSCLTNYSLVTDTDIEYLKDLMSNFMETLGVLYDSLSGIIPYMDTTITIKYIINVLTRYFYILEYETNFTEEQFERLQDFLFENTYRNEYVSIYDNDTELDIQSKAQSLYEQGQTVLGRVSLPRYEISGDFANILELPEYSDFSQKIELGKIVTVEIKKDTYVDCTLLEIETTYDDPTSFNLIFGNRVRLNNSSFQFSDMFLKSAQSSSGVSGTGG